MFRMHWSTFLQWLSKKEGSNMDENAMIKQGIARQLALEEGNDVQEVMTDPFSLDEDDGGTLSLVNIVTPYP